MVNEPLADVYKRLMLKCRCGRSHQERNDTAVAMHEYARGVLAKTTELDEAVVGMFSGLLNAMAEAAGGAVVSKLLMQALVSNNAVMVLGVQGDGDEDDTGDAARLQTH